MRELSHFREYRAIFCEVGTLRGGEKETTNPWNNNLRSNFSFDFFRDRSTYPEIELRVLVWIANYVPRRGYRATAPADKRLSRRTSGKTEILIKCISALVSSDARSYIRES